MDIPQAISCALCRSAPIYELGHIIPHFVYRHLIATGPTPFLRDHDNPNRRFQDGKKRRFLCVACEDRFSGWEAEFAKSVFRPLHAHQKTGERSVDPSKFQHGKWLLKFCVSISWRALYDLMADNESTPLPHGDEKCTLAALEVWRQFLIGERPSISPFDQHLIITGSPIETSGIENTTDLKLYFERAVTHQTWYSSTEACVFTKMCRITVAGVIKDFEHSWCGTKVQDSSGVFSGQDQVLPGLYNSWLRDDVAGLLEARLRVSSAQREVINAALQKYISRKTSMP